MAGGAAARRADDEDQADNSEDSPHPARGLPRALALTLASALVWGIAHLVTGRRVVGGLLLAAFLLMAGGAIALAAGVERAAVERFAVQPDRLTRVGIAAGVLAVLWAAIIIRSYQIVRPRGLNVVRGLAGTVSVLLVCGAVSAPLIWAGRMTLVGRDALTHISQATPGSEPVDQKDPWAGKPRLNVLLLGGDAAYNRTGVRTDSMTLASIDTATGDTVLISLPRNLENAPMPPGPAATRFPGGFTGDGPLNPGLLNEVFEYGENHPEVVPGVPAGQRGPVLLKATISRILGQPIDYYVLVNMYGFADIVDAMGGVELTVPEPIPYGLRGEVLAAGHRRLKGEEALWYGRSRTLSDDYARMSRQKCLLRAIARQAEPWRVVTKFEKLARAAKRTIATDIPSALWPALMDLSVKVKTKAEITSLQFVPPLIYTGNPNYPLIRRLTSNAIQMSATSAAASSATPVPKAGSAAGASATPSATPTAVAPVPGNGTAAIGAGGKGTGVGGVRDPSKPVSLDAVCPS